MGVPHILTAHGTYSIIWRRYFIDRKMYARVLRKAAYVCPVSNRTLELMRRYFYKPLLKTPAKPILIGTDYHSRVSANSAFNRELEKRPTFLSVGEVKTRKGYHVSIEAFGLVQKVFPDAQYWIVGDVDSNTYLNQLNGIILHRSITNVQFLGRLSDEQLQNCYRKAWVFVLTPQMIGDSFEGFGLVYLEAGGYGLPVVGSRVGGVPDAVREGETGFLAEPDDPRGIADAMIRLIENRELSIHMGRENRKWVAFLTRERYAEAQCEIYRDVICKK
jgi:glycosyltransferase involved in cell wall biosynthesis